MIAKTLFRLVIGIVLASSLLFFVASCSTPTESLSTTPDQPEVTVSSMKPGQEVSVEFIDTGTMPPMLADTSKTYYAYVETEKGTLVLELFAKDVPMTVSNFVYLALQGYYDDTTFHRVIPGFMAQGGDPTGSGTGGPGYTFANEITEHKHVAGTLSMAHSALPNSNGSQFFICYAAQPDLDGDYSVFGQLVEGMNVLESLTPRNPTTNPQFDGDKLLSVRIEVKEDNQ